MTKPKKELSPRNKVLRRFNKLIEQLKDYIEPNGFSSENEYVKEILSEVKELKLSFQEVTR